MTNEEMDKVAWEVAQCATETITKATGTFSYAIGEPSINANDILSRVVAVLMARYLRNIKMSGDSLEAQFEAAIRISEMSGRAAKILEEQDRKDMDHISKAKNQ